MALSLALIPLLAIAQFTPVLFTPSVNGQQFNCSIAQNGLPKQLPDEWKPTQSLCSQYVSSRFTLVDPATPEYNDLVEICTCTMINKGVNGEALEGLGEDEVRAFLDEVLFNGTDEVEENSGPKLSDIGGGTDDELEDYFEQLIGDGEFDEDAEEELKSADVDPQLEEQIMDSVQHGITTSLEKLLSKPMKPLESRDFTVVQKESFSIPNTRNDQKVDVEFKTYAPVAFDYLRHAYGFKTSDFLCSMGSTKHAKLVKFGNPGASGSGFYKTHDDKYFIKTERPNEAEFLYNMLPRYYANFENFPRSLLPKFVGQFELHGSTFGKFQFFAMNNLLPTNLTMHLRYDLKGSYVGRRASSLERAKKTPTYKDLDFKEQQPEGFTIEGEIYDALMDTLKKDVKFLKAFNIMDYSLLVGIHKISPDEKQFIRKTTMVTLNKTHHFDGIEATDGKGQKVVLFLGIIDILQEYSLGKRLENMSKSVFNDGHGISVQHPAFYAQRFYDFISTKVLRRAPPLKRF